MLRKITQCAGHVSANIRPHQLRVTGNWVVVCSQTLSGRESLVYCPYETCSDTHCN